MFASTWVDHDGVERRVPSPRRLKFKFPGHAALRAFVMKRDGYQCQWCGAKAVDVPEDYDGRDALKSDRIYPAKGRMRPFAWPVYLVVDHVLSIRNGGTNHPANMQCLCDSCNAAKSGLIDSKFRRPEAA